MFFLVLWACIPKNASINNAHTQDLAKREIVQEEMHGVMVQDPYQWMEDASNPETIDWTSKRNHDFWQYTNDLPQRSWLAQRLEELWRYDDESVPESCLLDENRQIVWTKSKEQSQWVVHLETQVDGQWQRQLLMDPNIWEEGTTLEEFTPSPDCQLAAVGRAKNGDENPVIQIMNLSTGAILNDSLKGWRQGDISWLHDNSGFFYSSWPDQTEVSLEDSHYYHRSLFHQIGTEKQDDIIVLEDRETKEFFHGVGVSEDGKWVIAGRYSFNSSKIWVDAIPDTSFDPRSMSFDAETALMEEMDAEYQVHLIEDSLIIFTNWKAPNYRVMITEVAKPSRDNWQELIPEGQDLIQGISLLNGHLFVERLHQAASEIDVFTLDGEKVQSLDLPTVGSARLMGNWHSETIYLSFSSFAFPGTTYTYNISTNALTQYKESSIPVDTSNIMVDQVFYPSKDGTVISMFVIYPKGVKEPIPFLLTGYGGFNVSMTPRFSTLFTTWIESGGGVAIPNLRGGGEYGEEWHQAGMRSQKQNVFDDFIAAAEFLTNNDYSRTEQLAIAGGSNGGLLVCAVVTQRPDLFQAVLCQVPLTDMIRYHRFGLANIWSEEYGNAEDPQSFPSLLAYSPYHNTVVGTDYPAVLITGSENDARTDPVHARKMAAILRYSDKDHGQDEPILLHLQSDSGHAGGVGIATQADQMSRHYAFLMTQIGLKTPPSDSNEPLDAQNGDEQ